MKKISYFLLVLCGAFVIFLSGCSKPAEPEKSPVETTADPHAKLKPERTFQGQFLDGTLFHSNDYAGRKIIFAFFSYKHKNSPKLFSMLKELKDDETSYLFRVIAVSLDYNEPEKVKEFVAAQNITFPVLIENSGLEIAMSLEVENEVALVGLDNKHRPYFAVKAFDPHEGEEQNYLSMLKESLSIPTQSGAKPRLGLYPKAPDFSATTMDGKKIRLSAYKGKVVLLVFFSPKCPHCHEEIKYLRESFYPDMKKEGLEVIAVSVFSLTDPEMKKATEDLKMPWPVIDDPSREIRTQYSSELGVPENFFIDKEGRVRFTSTGFNNNHVNLIVMRARSLLGIENPPLLSDKQFNGVESCMICHEAESVSWAVTPHAHAMETLEIKGEDMNVECVGCHSLGMNDPKGFFPMEHPQTGKKIARVPEPFENVQCEHCHGIGGIHKSEPLSEEALKGKCLECHTPEFSLHFDFDERVKKVNHSNAAEIMKMSESGRLALLEKVSKTPSELFGSKIEYVGNDSCLSCHSETHKNWQNSVHAKTTKDFSPKTADQTSIKDQSFSGANCESCHGPGGLHVKSKLKKDIRGLGADCPFCVIEQICLSCHTPKNDPNFNLVTDLEKIRGHK